MDIQEQVIREWFCRLPKGYAEPPYTDTELETLAETMRDLGAPVHLFAPTPAIVTSNASIPNIIEEAVEVDENIVSDMMNTLEQEARLEPSLIPQIFARFETLSKTEQENFVKQFRSNNVKTFVNSGYKAFEKFFDIIPTGKSTVGMGRGEVMCVLGITNSRSGGTAEHDVIVSGDPYEVKQLSDGSLDPADYGKISKHILTEEINTFYRQLVIPYYKFDMRDVLLSDLTGEPEKIENILDIFEENFPEKSPGGKNIYMGSEITYTIFDKWYTGFTALSKLMDKSLLDGLPQNRMTIKGSVDNTYWIDDDAAAAIANANANDQVTISVGEEITNENRYASIWLQRMIQSKFISNPDYFIDELRRFRDGFFGEEIAGLIYFNGKDTTPYIGNADEFATTHITRGVYRIGLKTRYTKYKHVQAQ